MKRSLLFDGLKILVLVGMLFSLVAPATTLAQVPIQQTTPLGILLPENVKPEAQPDSYETPLETKLIVDAEHGVLANDDDDDGDLLTAVLVASPAQGYLDFETDGSFEYTPAAGYVGNVYFTYRASDGTLTSNPAQVTIVVTGGDNTPPVANPDSYETPFETQLIVTAEYGVLANDYDDDGDTLTASQLGVPAHGIVTLYSNGGFTYTPDADYTGQDQFSYRAYDGTDYSLTAVVTITITGGDNEEPEANADSYATDINIPLIVDAATGVLANDSDADGDTLTAEALIQPVNGSLIFNSDGSFTYTPDAGYTGDDHFTYEAYDGIEYSDPAMVTITVNPINTAPVAVADSYSTPMNTPLVVDALTGVLANDVDADFDLLTADLYGTPVEFGVLNLNPDGSFTYFPQTNYYGTVYFTYRAYDSIDYSNPVTVAIDVTSTNTTPVAQPDSYLMLMNTELHVGDAEGVLANDYDADGDLLTAEVTGTPIAFGILTLDTDGSFIYVPTADTFGVVYFTYVADDGIDTSAPVQVTITIKEENTAPVAVADEYAVDSGSSLAVESGSGVLANDGDADGDLLEAWLVTDVHHGVLTLDEDGSFIYTPYATYIGMDHFSYRAFDGLVFSEDVYVSITVGEVVNVPPVAVADSYVVGAGSYIMVAAPGVLLNDSDVNFDLLTAVMVDGVAHGSLFFNSNGSFTYVPIPSYVGVDHFTYQAYDDELYSEEVTVTINVVPVTYAYLPFLIR